ncbi:hypothetical protein HDU76_011534 [Blyttiomyces sp. JEL0837]|nr:hypothetical protein HDU76_011534 [Blyttiomyces sp. JEL0837]
MINKPRLVLLLSTVAITSLTFSSLTLAVTTGLWGPPPKDTIDGSITGYDLVGAFDFDSQNATWRSCVSWAQGFGNEIHAFSWDPATNLCSLKQLPYYDNYQTTFGGHFPVKMLHAHVDDDRFALGSYTNVQVSYDQCNAYCGTDPLCFSAQYNTVTLSCETRQLIKTDNPDVIFTLPWWNTFPQENAAPPRVSSTGTTSSTFNVDTISSTTSTETTSGLLIPPTTSPTAPPSTSSSSSVPVIGIAGGVVGGLVVEVVAVVLFVYVRRRTSEQQSGLVIVDRNGFNGVGKGLSRSNSQHQYQTYHADTKLTPLFDSVTANAIASASDSKTEISGGDRHDLSLETALQNQFAKRIDGSILHTLDRDCIKNDLGITDIILRGKLLTGIEMLRDSQPRYGNALESHFSGGFGFGDEVAPPSYPAM